MASVFRAVIAVVLGLLLGGAVNMALIMVSGRVIPPPSGADVTTMAGLKASLHLFEPRHFVFPFLAHAAGTFVGAVVASLVTAKWSFVVALVAGGFFLAGGIANVIMLPAPMWFNAVDLLFAYLPMAWLGHRLARSIRPA
jgi:hypothetical protein